MGYFSSNLESVRNDVECLFGILKKRWKSEGVLCVLHTPQHDVG
jgi:hypothetical protein